MPEQRERVMLLVSRFMAWKLAMSYVLTAEVWLGPEFKHGGEEAILSVGVSRHERIGLVQRIRHRDPLNVTSPEWLTADQIDEAYTALLPSKTSEITAEEIEQLFSVTAEKCRRICRSDATRSSSAVMPTASPTSMP